MNRALVATALTFAATAAFAAGNSATASANAKVKIRKAITLTSTADLDFGGVIIANTPSGAGDTVVVSPAGAVTSTNTGVVVGTFNTTAAAKFTVGGTKNATYVVTLPSAPITIPASGSVTVGTFTSTSVNGTYTLDASGADTLNVGGTLTLPNTAVEGVFSVPFSVTVAYN